MKSVEIPNVVSIRSSGDYRPGNSQWDIGMTGIWTFALGLAPFKDTFWTTPKEPGHPGYDNNTAEWHPKLEAAMATLSTGIVGISDESKYINTIYRRNLSHILWDKIAHRKPFGLFYPLETCFSSYFFHP